MIKFKLWVADPKARGITSKKAKKKKKIEKKKKIGSRPSLVHELSARHALSGQGSTGAKRGVKHEDVGFVTRAKRGAHAKRAIQHKHTLNLLHALSA